MQRVFKIGTTGYSPCFFANDSLVFDGANGGDTETIKHIVLTYEVASGLKTNYEKFAITFSLNVQQVHLDGVLRVLGLTSVATHDKYLGLPTVIDVALELAHNHLSKFKEYGRLGLHLGVGLTNSVTNLPTRWIPPPLDSFSLATDALAILRRGFVRLGGVIRDAGGVVWLAWSLMC
uniref:Uncharacterized protein n=1 Tax=Cannabis sativa TaxID=3483 RepID=A0A803PJ54_CANSA